MGVAISALRAQIGAADDEVKKKAEQNLEVLQKAVDSQLNEFESQLDAKFMNPAGTEKIEVPGIRALRKVRFSNVTTSKVPSEEISGAIDTLFSIGGEGVDTKTAVTGGFKKVVTGALNAFIGNGEAGQHTENKYFIYMQHNAIVRLDLRMWRWNFSGKGFNDEHETALGYVVCTSIVDVGVLRTSEFVFLISEYAGDSEEEGVKYITKMEKLYERARLMKLNEVRQERRALLDINDPLD